MLKITTVFGNISDKKINLKNTERLQLTRTELEKTRLRKETDKGTDIGLALDSGILLHDGDILTEGSRTIVVKQLPEKVIELCLKEGWSIDTLILIGHIIGNRHRPISIEKEIVYFPVQADSELQVFEQLFAELRDKIELSITERIFKPHLGANVHDHR